MDIFLVGSWARGQRQVRGLREPAHVFGLSNISTLLDIEHLAAPIHDATCWASLRIHRPAFAEIALRPAGSAGSRWSDVALM